MSMDKENKECPDCGEPVDDYGDSLEDPCCHYAPACELCGSASCDQSC